MKRYNVWVIVEEMTQTKKTEKYVDIRTEKLAKLNTETQANCFVHEVMKNYQRV